MGSGRLFGVDSFVRMRLPSDPDWQRYLREIGLTSVLRDHVEIHPMLC